MDINLNTTTYIDDQCIVTKFAFFTRIFFHLTHYKFVMPYHRFTLHFQFKFSFVYSTCVYTYYTDSIYAWTE